MHNDHQAVATRETSEVGKFQQQLVTRARDIQAALPAHISLEKFQRTLLTAVAQDPELLKADRQSLVLACYKAAQDGLLPDKREAALVVFSQSYKDGNEWKKRKLVQYMPMVYGLRKKIVQSGEVSTLEVGVVYRVEAENGYFRYEVGTEPPLNHTPMLEIAAEDATDDKIIAFYSIATMKDGTKSYEVMRRFEVDKVRECSQTGATHDKFGKPRKPSGPWVEWFPEQGKKTVMRRHSKVLPMSGDVFADVEGRELEHSASALTALASTAPDAPLAIEDQGGDTFVDNGETVDSGTGEVVDQGESSDVVDATKTEKKAKVSTKKAEPAAAEQADEATDEDHPAKPFAEKLLETFANAPTVAAIEKAYADAETAIEAMPDELADTVNGAYNRYLTRLRQPATAG